MMKYSKKQTDYPKTAIIIVSYNNKELTQACIESIRVNNPAETYQLIVVDNASTDGVTEWLAEQKDITLIVNQENKGFPYACNQGIAAAEKEADIFLLNNDTVVPKDALFWLREGLYSDEKVGATGSVSNNVVNYQQVPEQFTTLEEWLAFAEQNNVEMEYPYEKKGWLVGFAMLIKRTAMNKILVAEGKEKDAVPEVLDTRFSPGNYEDNDLSIRLLKNGYELLLCKNSFIFHHGGKSFGKQNEKYTKLLLENQKKLADKYGIDFIPYSYVEMALLDMIKPVKPDFSLLEIGCKLGASLARIESRYPQSKVCGIEENEKLAELAKQVAEVRCEDILEIDVEGNSDYDEKYDYILLNHVLEKYESAEEVLKRAARCAKPGGTLLVSVDNRQCIRSVEKGFTLDEIVELFNRYGLQLKEFNYRPLLCSEEEKKKLAEIMKYTDASMRPLYEAERFIFAAGKAL
ncbi:glycosyltransferase [Roseburia sp. 499]|uniref:glycosyltransferase n=1 Tax=Roseburia sp. 499 TaxID=1261634 RepID=UPI000952FB53|nr:glycosyltransferase [Roseburia sp. 499]WVK70049.1 glycosyltransferase [Roseburia sp. 499]